MGFTTEEGAIQWIQAVCKGEPLTPDNWIFKAIPVDIKNEILNIK